MKKYLSGLFFVAIATVAVLPPMAEAAATTTTSTTKVSALLELLQNLMKQAGDLQNQLSQVKSDIKDQLKDGLHEGMEDEDIRKIQELLATDPTLYPAGKVSGFFGPLTKEAIKKFQERHALKMSGEVDSETKSLILEYFKEKTDGKIPPGLLRAPGIDKKIKDRLREHEGKFSLDCDEKKAAGPLCKDKEKERGEEMEKDEHNRNASTSTTTLNTNSVLSSSTQKAIAKAESAINDLEEAIAAATDEEAIAEAEEMLSKANDKLDEAQSDLSINKYRSAMKNALKAAKMAMRGIINLNKSEDN